MVKEVKMNQEEKFREMAHRNDVIRKLGLNVTLTKKAAELPNLEELLYRVRSYNDFNTKIDPEGWHDMGRFEWRGQKVIWKIDYFNETLQRFEDPLSEECKRVLTVMLKSEY